jgi:transposase
MSTSNGKHERRAMLAAIDEGRRQDGPASTEREELSRLRRENRLLHQERDILAKAAAWFARKTDVTAPGSSNS